MNGKSSSITVMLGSNRQKISSMNTPELLTPQSPTIFKLSLKFMSKWPRKKRRLTMIRMIQLDPDYIHTNSIPSVIENGWRIIRWGIKFPLIAFSAVKPRSIVMHLHLFSRQLSITRGLITPQINIKMPCKSQKFIITTQEFLPKIMQCPFKISKIAGHPTFLQPVII